MINEFTLNGIQIKTGDIICTEDGDNTILPGQFWRLLGLFITGDVDHVIIYVGPDGRFIEAGPKGVVEFYLDQNDWDAEKISSQRAGILDSLYGIAFPLKNQNYSSDSENNIREFVSEYCRNQVGKPYNFNFFDTDTEDAFYCSQLIYKAYLQKGIDLNTGMRMPELPGTECIIYPQEIWNSSYHIKII